MQLFRETPGTRSWERERGRWRDLRGKGTPGTPASVLTTEQPSCGKSTLWEVSEISNFAELLTSVFLSVLDKSYWCSFLPSRKTDATNVDVELESARLMTSTLQSCFFPPFKDKLRVCLSHQRDGKRKMISGQKV